MNTGMSNYTKYKRSYYIPPETCIDWMKKEYIEKAPKWCSVDLRDGNQALITPMSMEEKIEFFKLLCKIGFKEIEVGFPAASETEYKFLRTLIKQDLIPEDVTIQVLTQAREHIIKKTFEALNGCHNAVIHLYNSTSVAQREQVFKKSKEEVLKIAVAGAELLKRLTEEAQENYRFEYSPESFTGTEPEYAVEVCNAVLDVWKPTEDRKVIINLPVTVEVSMPHIYASQIEYCCKHIKYREGVEISLHPHNDRGCAVADGELGILAGADRIEGTLFGNGERTGNVDIITLAMNMYTHGINPKLDFSNMSEITKIYEKVTCMHVYERQPYSGTLVFAAFSGSHQDAIAKGMKYREQHHSQKWTVPYLPIDPEDVGRTYQTDVIRVNSQSGKGGIGYLMEQNFGYVLPAKMQEEFGYIVKDVSDHNHKELVPEEIMTIFNSVYVNKKSYIALETYHFELKKDGYSLNMTIRVNDSLEHLAGRGTGRLEAVSNALNEKGFCHTITTYNEHALKEGADSCAAAYVCVETKDRKQIWGAGVHEDIITASILGLFSAINRMTN